jgi:trehalose utilization protein
VANFDNFLFNVSVTLYDGATKFPMFVEKIGFQQNYKTQWVYGNPYDWMQMVWTGGEVSFSGCLYKTGTGNIFRLATIEQIRVGDDTTPTVTLYTCKKQSVDLTMQTIGTKYSVLHGSLVYRFDAYAAA